MIGTSTTLIVNGMLKEQYDEIRAARAELPPEEADREWPSEFVEGVRPMSLFEIGRVGLPCALVGTGVLLLISRRMLPDRTELIESLEEHRREYVVEMMVQPECRLIGQTIEVAGLRELPGLYLIEIDRDGEIVTPVGPEDVIRTGDRLVFVGVVSTIVDLEQISGLVPAAESIYGEHLRQDHRRNMTEAVLSRSSPLIGTTVKAANFRRRYNAAVVAVHRSGERLSSKIGEIDLQPGDTILLQTRNDFVAQHRNNPDFYLVSSVGGDIPRGGMIERCSRGGLSLLLILWLILANLDFLRERFATFDDGAFPAVAAIAVAGLLVVTRCVSIPDARGSLNLEVLLTIVGALGLGKALQSSGAAAAIAAHLVEAVGPRHLMLLILIYILGALFTELITNNAVATILLPLAIEVAQQAQISPRPFVMAIALSASLAFLTPVGYQTNLMVMGPGGYRPYDYLKVGAPLSVTVAVTAVALIPWVWPF